MKKQPERTALTRNTFIETFFELCREKDIDEISIRELTDRAGYNRSTFYQYFDDMSHLRSRVEDDMIQFITEKITREIDQLKPEALFVTLFVEVCEKKRDYMKLLFGRRNTGDFACKLKEHLIPAFAAQMQISLENPSNVYLLDFYLSGIISVITRWVSSQEMMAPEAFAHLVRRIVEGMGKSELLPIRTLQS